MAPVHLTHIPWKNGALDESGRHANWILQDNCLGYVSSSRDWSYGMRILQNPNFWAHGKLIMTICSGNVIEARKHGTMPLPESNQPLAHMSFFVCANQPMASRHHACGIWGPQRFSPQMLAWRSYQCARQPMCSDRRAEWKPSFVFMWTMGLWLLQRRR